MADETNGKADFRAPAVAVENISFRDQLVMMLRAFMASPLRNTIFRLAAGALAVIVATSLGQIILNRWNRPFYDAIERRDPLLESELGAWREGNEVPGSLHTHV